MATIAHISHDGLTQLSDAGDLLRFAGTLGNCTRLAAAHGLTWEACPHFSHLSQRLWDRFTLFLEGTEVGCIMDLRTDDHRSDQYQIAILRTVWKSE